MKSRQPIKRLHSMSEFGTVFGATQIIRVNRLEKRHKPLVPFPHRHAFYHLVAVTSGYGWHEIDFERFSISPGKVFFMKPGQVHSWHLSEKTQGFVIEFEESAIPTKGPETGTILQIVKSLQAHYAHSKTKAKYPSKVFGILKAMLSEYEDQASNFELALKHYLTTLLIELSRLNESTATQPLSVDPTLDRFFSLIEENYQKQHEVAFYAQQLAASSKSLTMRSFRAYGKSARTFIQDRLILESKRMLAYSNLSIAEIGYELGFEDPNYFSRFFREHVGATPGDFRNKTRDLTAH
jgi:AraC-like DNA-binding protein